MGFVRRLVGRDESCSGNASASVLLVLMDSYEDPEVLCARPRQHLEMHNPTYICPMGALLFDRRPMVVLSTFNITLPVGLFSANKCASQWTNSSSSSCFFLRDEAMLPYVDWASLPLTHAHISSPFGRTPPTHTLRKHVNTHTP